METMTVKTILLTILWILVSCPETSFAKPILPGEWLLETGWKKACRTPPEKRIYAGQFSMTFRKNGKYYFSDRGDEAGEWSIVDGGQGRQYIYLVAGDAERDYVGLFDSDVLVSDGVIDAHEGCFRMRFIKPI